MGCWFESSHCDQVYRQVADKILLRPVKPPSSDLGGAVPPLTTILKHGVLISLISFKNTSRKTSEARLDVQIKFVAPDDKLRFFSRRVSVWRFESSKVHHFNPDVCQWQSMGT